jgi:hypothetical protein
MEIVFPKGTIMKEGFQNWFELFHASFRNLPNWKLFVDFQIQPNDAKNSKISLISMELEGKFSIKIVRRRRLSLAFFSNGIFKKCFYIILCCVCCVYSFLMHRFFCGLI